MMNDPHPWLNTYPASINQDFCLSPEPVFSLLNHAVGCYGFRPAFDFLGKKWNWAEIGVLSDRFAEGLQKQGLEKGERVALFLPNTPYYLIAYYGVLKAGGVVVNLNPLYPERELIHLLGDSGAQRIVTCDLSLLTDKIYKVLPQSGLKQVILCPFTEALPFPKNFLFKVFKSKEIASKPYPKQVILYEDLIENEGDFSAVDIDPLEDVAVLQYTGGTTGLPKGAMLTHANIHANAHQCLIWCTGARPGQQKMLGVLPFFHVFAMTAVMNLSVLAGFEIIALPRFELKDTLKTIHKKHPHFFPAVPAIYTAMNNDPKSKHYDLSSLEYCISGGAPLPVEVKKDFESKTGCIVVEGYGLSESSPVACVNPFEGDNVAGSIGLPLPGTIIEIVDPDDKTTLKALGEKGELCIRGPQVMKGYWNKPDETALTLRDGRLHTGDIAYMDERGYVFIVDRLKDMIITNGYNVYPRNVEEAIYLHPAIEECVVAGIPDARRGEIVKAWVKCKAGWDLDADKLKAFLKDKLSPMQMPKRIEFREEALPKTMIGKLSRKDLVEEKEA